MQSNRMTQQSHERTGISAFGPELAQLVVVMLWASTFVVTKSAFAEITPLAFIFVRFALMIVLSFAVLVFRRNTDVWRIRRADLPRFLAAGVTGYTLYQLGFVLGLDRTSPFSSSLLIAMVPLFTLLLLALRRESTPWQAWLGIFIAVVGVGIFLVDKQGQPGTQVGDALSLGAAISFALYGIVNRPLVRSYPPETYTAYTVLAGSIPLLVLSIPAALAQNWAAVSLQGWIATIYMVILPVYVAYMLWNWAIARRGVATATSFSLLVPVLSGILSAIFFAESFGALKLVGAALVLGGLITLRLRPRA